MAARGNRCGRSPSVCDDDSVSAAANDGLVRVWAIGAPGDGWMDGLRLPDAGPSEADGFVVSRTDSDEGALEALAELRPHVIVTFGPVERHRELAAAPLAFRRRWIHLDELVAPAEVARRIVAVMVDNATRDRFPDIPVVSVFTPTYNTGERVYSAYASICAQTYSEWEWVVYDDSDDGGLTFEELRRLAAVDPRVKVFRSDRRSGSIGEVKRRACGLCLGAILVELDHDDRLMPRCLEHVVTAARSFPDAGFFYSDGAEMRDDGTPVHYPEGWAFGFGDYRVETIDGRDALVQCYPPVNAKTIRHITGAPNHVRAWTADAYRRAGGHSPDLDVCDDYDLIVRTFLTTRMVHIPHCCYVQVYSQRNGGNAQRSRNPEIQRLTRLLAQRYEPEIHARFVELGVADFIWLGEGRLEWSRSGPPDGAPANYRLAPSSV